MHAQVPNYLKSINNKKKNRKIMTRLISQEKLNIRKKKRI